MSDFLNKLKKSMKSVADDYSYYDVERAVISMMEDGELTIFDGVESPMVAVSPDGAEWASNAILSHEGEFNDDELGFVVEAASNTIKGASVKGIDIKPATITVFSVEKGMVTENSYFRKSGKSYSMTRPAGESTGNLASVINKLHRGLKQSGDPALRQQAEAFKAFSGKVKRERDVRLENYPELSGEFWPDVTAIYEYSACFEEFNALINGTSVHDMSDRHLSRLSRATLAFAGEKLGSGTVYRAVPVGVDDIEAGDWVSMSEDYCESHAEEMRSYGEEYHIISKEAHSEVAMLTDENEYVYLPDGCWDGAESLGEVWNEINTENKPKMHPTIESLFEEQCRSSHKTLKM
ncbi:hypothetical protein VCHA53O466_50317 [Vibrio chagasii]|nr:hypothetical protein VCHA53O466_50317 [Vibrio chagasii]